MTKLTTLVMILFISFLSTPSWSNSEVDLLEVKLLNNLDDKKSFANVCKFEFIGHDNNFEEL